ncbi:protein-L-isoaspartate(D-aspartate) O-methyltransferase [Phycicoccus badiiscoriae]|uniref:Protein-L-isoaspartate O-methyltransferase n=1 Tax=Pedococcus badiiscoriae TaxID=642776 RepID=A0A852WKP0_9MICO|nr:protein-L-isoaspartate(D-aspartate) O-methyltransferase [Pedococcus badiiscoriae]
MPSTAERVAEAMQAVPRLAFLPLDQRPHSERDAPLPIGHGQTNSQPTTVRQMLELLDVQPGDRILDVGSGSGWSTALLAHLTGPTGGVTGIERVPALVTFGAANLASRGMPWAHVEAAVPGVLGHAAHGPFDRILVSAQARTLPAELVRQLAPRGVLVIPVAGRMLRVVARDDGPTVEEHGWYRFVPLVTD